MTFPAGRDEEPAGQRRRLADLVKLAVQLEPRSLTHIVCVGLVEAESAADAPHHPAVPLDHLFPRQAVPRPGPIDQGDHSRVVSHLTPPCRRPNRYGQGRRTPYSCWVRRSWISFSRACAADRRPGTVSAASAPVTRAAE